MPLSYLPVDFEHCVTADYDMLAKPTLLGYTIKVAPARRPFVGGGVAASCGSHATPSPAAPFARRLQVHNHAENAGGKPLGPLTTICAKEVNVTAGKLQVRRLARSSLAPP